MQMRKLTFIVLTSLLLILSGCGKSDPQMYDWGSFSPDKTHSYDNKYYAVQTVEEKDNCRYIVVSICTTQTDEFVFSFTPAREADFYGICWENDTYNIWIQSADIGVLCYKYEKNTWVMDDTTVRPDYIHSKYDKYSTMK